ncbi:MAG: DNA primase [Methylococcales bacterium]|nr:MAG: DNA primase [Methylococcales bacterium]
MSGRIPRDFIDDLLVRVDIVDLIDSHTPLKKTGTNYVACCPFHTEKTPSFSVTRNKQFFHCFGCGVSGNAISFLMMLNNLDFVEAVEDLAAFAGIEVPREVNSPQAIEKKDDLNNLYLLMDQAADFYVQQLRSSDEGKKAVEYLKARGINGDCANEFLLGYAPNEWKALANSFDHNALIKAGLLVNKDDGQVYDRFRNRIIFPIRDKRGRIIGFGGRVLDDTLPKYLNSPETPLFHKGNEVYGLHELLKKNPKPAQILIVEGYMDVISLSQFGINYAVAALGTATSLAHLNLLFRFSTEIVLCFDGDKAGRNAAWKAMEAVFLSLKDNRSCRIMMLPQNHDPDSLIREEGLSNFTLRVKTAQALSDYFFEQISENLNLSEMEGRAQLVGKAKPYIEKLPEGIFREMMLDRLKAISGIPSLNTPNKTTKPNNLYIEKKTTKISNHSAPAKSASTATALLLQNPRLIHNINQKEFNWDELEIPGIDLFKNIQHVILNKNAINTAVLIEHYRNTADEKTIKTLATLDLYVSENNIDTIFADALNSLLKQGKYATIAKLETKAQNQGLDIQEQQLLIKLLTDK